MHSPVTELRGTIVAIEHLKKDHSGETEGLTIIHIAIKKAPPDILSHLLVMDKVRVIRGLGKIRQTGD